jgi:hypothetical protein
MGVLRPEEAILFEEVMSVRNFRLLLCESSVDVEKNIAHAHVQIFTPLWQPFCDAADIRGRISTFYKKIAIFRHDPL